MDCRSEGPRNLVSKRELFELGGRRNGVVGAVFAICWCAVYDAPV